ncbi:DUF2971 domain-containing protein [Agarivorans sp. MS3-6]
MAIIVEKLNHHHTYSYKFQSLNILNLAAIGASDVWFSSMNELNDPFEGLSKIEEVDADRAFSHSIGWYAQVLVDLKGYSSAEAIKEAQNKYHSDPPRFIEFVEEEVSKGYEGAKEFQQSLSVYSASWDLKNSPLISSVYNILMWSHYGDGLKGYCLKFDTALLLDSIKQLNLNCNVGLSPVKYTSSLSEISKYQSPKSLLESFVHKALNKSEHWEYEREVRFLSNKHGLHKFDSQALKEVYIGSKMPKQHRELLLSVLARVYSHVKIFEVGFDASAYNLVVKELPMTLRFKLM